MEMDSLPWEEVEHTADWALRVRGENLGSLFENAARGMVSLLDGQINPDQRPVQKTFTLQAPDYETLLVDWLSELLYLIEEADVVFTAITVRRVQDLTLEAEISGQAGGSFNKHIKAVTYHNLAIQQSEVGYETTVVFDV